MHAASDKILFVIATCISTTKYASGQHTFSDYKTIQASLTALPLKTHMLQRRIKIHFHT
jgi:hypothetical protein